MVSSCFSQPMQNCLVLSLSFMFVYTAYSPLFFIQSTLNHDANLGVTSLSVTYVCAAVFSTISPLLIRVFGAKWVTNLAWFAFIIFTVCNAYPTWATLIPASTLVGMVVGTLWTSNNLYLENFAEDYAKLQGLSSEKDLHSTMSRFVGIFFMFFHLTGISGNLISSLVFTTGVHTNASQTLDFDLCGANDCPWTDYSNGSSNTTEGFIEPERHVVYILLGILLGFNVCGLLLTIFALPPLEQAETSKSSTICGHSVSLLRMVIHPDMIRLIPLFMTEPVLIATLAGSYTKNFVGCPLGVQWVGFVMTTYGVFCAVASFSVNHFAKYLGRPVMFLSAILLGMASFIFMLLWQPSTNDSLLMYFIVPLMAGVSQGILNPQMIAIVSRVFKDNKSEAFATLNIAKGTSYALVFTLSLFVCPRQRLVMALCLDCVASVGYTWTEVQIRRRAACDESTELINGDPKLVT